MNAAASMHHHSLSDDICSHPLNFFRFPHLIMQKPDTSKRPSQKSFMASSIDYAKPEDAFPGNATSSVEYLPLSRLRTQLAHDQ